jgi:AraC family transcriptional regulator
MKVYECIVEKKISMAGMPTFVFHETSPDAVREAHEKGTAIVEVAWPVFGTVKGSGEMRICELPGGMMVRSLHPGPYEPCKSTCLALFSWMKERHLQVAGPICGIHPKQPPGRSDLKRSSPESWSLWMWENKSPVSRSEDSLTPLSLVYGGFTVMSIQEPIIHNRNRCHA